MKKYLFAIIIAFVFSSLYFPKQAFSQYQSVFGNNQTSWVRNTWEFTPEFVVCNPDSIWIDYNKDTTFNNMVFKPIYTKSILNNNVSLGGYASEDSTNGEVWYRNVAFDTNIYKIVDLGLTTNDSFYLGQWQTKVGVDSIFYQQGLKHIQLDYQIPILTGHSWQYDTVKYTMIEGVGVNVFGVLCGSLNGVVKKKWKDSTLDYTAILDSAFYCQTISGISEKYADVHLRVFPNPIHQTAVIETEGIIAEKIELFDVNGQLVKSFPLKSELNFGKTKNGIYLLQVTTKDNHQFSKKVVVQH